MAAPKKTAPRKAAKAAPKKAAKPVPAPVPAPAAAPLPPPPPPPTPLPTLSPAPPAAPRRMDPSEERQYAMLLHLSALAGVVLSGLFFVGPLVMWLVKKDESAFVDRHGRAAIDFFLSLLIYGAVLAILLGAFAIVTLGIGVLLLLPVIILLAIVAMVALILLPILAAVKAHNGQEFRYPLAIAFLSKSAAPTPPPAP